MLRAEFSNIEEGAEKKNPRKKGKHGEPRRVSTEYQEGWARSTTKAEHENLKGWARSAKKGEHGVPRKAITEYREG